MWPYQVSTRFTSQQNATPSIDCMYADPMLTTVSQLTGASYLDFLQFRKTQIIDGVPVKTQRKYVRLQLVNILIISFHSIKHKKV